jgi:carbonic anhydrase
MLTFSNEDLRGKLAADTGSDASHMDFLPFTDLEESVRDDVRRIRNYPFIPPDVEVSGWVYDVKTGKLQEIVPVGR